MSVSSNDILVRFAFAGRDASSGAGHRQAQQWLAKQLDNRLPVTHFLVTFTLPAELRKVARSNQKAVYGILMKAAAAALQKLAWRGKWIGGLLGIVSVLQTWRRDLAYHPHVHMIVMV